MCMCEIADVKVLHTGDCNSLFNFSLGEVCSHVAALLFKIEAFVRLGFTNLACTSKPCIWNQALSKKVTFSTINFFVQVFDLSRMCRLLLPP